MVRIDSGAKMDFGERVVHPEDKQSEVRIDFGPRVVYPSN